MLTRAPQVPLASSPGGTELAALLAPVTPNEFVREYFAKKPLFVKGFKEKFQGFFDAEAFSRVLEAPGPDDFLRASFDRKTAAGTSAAAKSPNDVRSTAFRATVEQAVPLFEAGATLCVAQVETRVPWLAPFAAAIKRQLGYPGRVSFNAYLSPPGSGFNWHFDSRIASTLQIEGSKVWRFSRDAAIAWPRTNGTLHADGTARYAGGGIVAADGERLGALDESQTIEVLLEPGDLLVLPAGVWHEACGGSGGSLALNLSFTPVSYTAIIGGLLDALLIGEAGWRGPSPVPGDECGVTDADGIAAIAAQLKRAADVLGSLEGDSAAVVRLWQTFVQNQTVDGPLAGGSSHPVIPAQRLRVRADCGVHAMLADGGTRLFLAIGANRRLELSGDAVAFVQRILSERTFLASDCTAWTAGGEPFAWEDVQAMLANLKAQGLLEEAD